MNKTPVIFDHDGGVDDLLSLMLLLTMDHIDLVAVSITPADCFLQDATVSTLKILHLFGRDDIPVVQGRLHGVNPFHYTWRAQPKMCNALPQMLTLEPSQNNLLTTPADQYIADTLAQANAPITILMTGPCTNLTAAIELNPDAKSQINKLIWMGGAVDVKGNVANYNHDGSGEWNVYWDPFAAAQLFASGIEIDLLTLNASNSLPIDEAFLRRLAEYREHPLCELAGQFWATTVASIPSYEYTYFLWDVLATSLLGLEPGIVEFERMELAVATEEPSHGKTYRAPGNGQWINVATNADREKVLSYVIEQFQFRPSGL